MKIIPLSEGSFTIDQTKQFVPFDKLKDELQDRPRGSLLVEIQPFVVLMDDEVVLIDTGLGFSDDRNQLQLHRNLIENGINPMDVTTVLMSHLHKDHAGGIGRKDQLSGEWHLSFPQAKYYIHEKEWEEAKKPNNPSYLIEQMQALENSSNLILLNREEGQVGPNISYYVTGAHSPFHQVFKIKENQEIVFFGGDEAPQWQQMKSRFVAKYDFDGKKSMELRQQWMDVGVKEGWTFLFYHDIGTPIVKV
jgi:glyoxylase-like metal-dependent hydrolase (beta-lactamase superfamily II)